MEVFRRNAQPHIADMRTGGAWGYIPNKQAALVVTRGIACQLAKYTFDRGREAARFILRKIRMPELQTQSFCTVPRIIERQST